MYKLIFKILFFTLTITTTLFYNLLASECDNQIIDCPIPKPGVVNKAKPGCFDFYIFAQFWEPESCFYYNRYSTYPCSDLYKDFDGRMFAHGLWPNSLSTVKNEASFPMNCSKELFDFKSLSKDLQIELMDLYPGAQFSLLSHEWLKHGTCVGFSQEKYFKKLVEYQKRMMEFSKDLFYKNMGKSITYQNIIDNYPGLNISVKCKFDKKNSKQYLSELHTTWDKNDTPFLDKFKFDHNFCKTNSPIYIRNVAKYKHVDQWLLELKSQYNHNKKILLVGFDIDDTLLFSTPGFQYLMNQKNMDIKSNIFWKVMNSGYDDFSVPINLGAKVLSFHKKRGDKIYFITNRRFTEGEKVTERMQKLFNINDKEMNPIIFLGGKRKEGAIKNLGLNIYYGDSDNDMLSAEKAGSQPVRIPRSNNSNNPSPSNNGAFGEVILME